MFKKASLGFAFLFSVTSASAQWEATVGYSSLDAGPYLDLGAVVLGAGYNISVNNWLIITPTVRVGQGVRSDEIPWITATTENGQPVIYDLTAKTEASKYYGLQIRAQVQINSGVYLFAAPSYSMLEIKYSPDTLGAVGMNSPDLRTDDWGFGVGAGAGMKFTDSLSAEISYEMTEFSDIGDADVLNAQLHFMF